jgi:hypothetical protein
MARLIVEETRAFRRSRACKDRRGNRPGNNLCIDGTSILVRTTIDLGRRPRGREFAGRVGKSQARSGVRADVFAGSQVVAHLRPAPAPELVEASGSLVDELRKALGHLGLLNDGDDFGFVAGGRQPPERAHDRSAALAFLVGRGDTYGHTRSERNEKERRLPGAKALPLSRATEVLVPAASTFLALLQRLLHLVQLLIHVPLHLQAPPPRRV